MPILPLLYVQFGLANINSQELHSYSNAASITSETHSFSGWRRSATESSISTKTFSGSYSIKFEVPSNGWFYSGYSFNSTQNEQYTVQIFGKSQSTESPGIYWSGVIESQSTPITIASTNWTLYSKMVAAKGSAINISAYPGTPAVGGNSVSIDKISIVPFGGIDTQAPTAPSWVRNSQSRSTVDFSWNGAMDNTGITDYTIYKDGVLNAAGNESTASNAVSVTTDVSSGSGGGSSVWSESNSVASYTGSVGVGTSTIPSGYKLAVNGKIITEELKVQLQSAWPDYVFSKEYELPSLEEIQKHIEEKGHLPNIPSATEVEVNGVELGEMNKLLLEKIEELTLYLLQQEERIKKLENKKTYKN
ncbi:MAG: hypothetical protein ABJN84_04260 [Flavobacteriaceae bacterium]